MSDEYKQYLDEKFNRVFDHLENIESEVMRTNGRVTTLEQKVVNLEVNRVVSCPQNKKIEAIEQRLTNRENSLIEYDVLKKHPLTVIGIIIVTIGVLASGVFAAFDAAIDFFRALKL